MYFNAKSYVWCFDYNVSSHLSVACCCHLQVHDVRARAAGLFDGERADAAPHHRRHGGERTARDRQSICLIFSDTCYLV